MKVWTFTAFLLLAPLAGCGGGGPSQNRTTTLSIPSNNNHSIPPANNSALPTSPWVSVESSGITALAVPSNSKFEFPLLPLVGGDTLEQYTTDTLTTWIRQSRPSDFAPSKVPALEALPLTTKFSFDGYFYELTNQDIDSRLAVYSSEIDVSPVASTPLHFGEINSAYVSNVNDSELIAIGNWFPYSCPKFALCKPLFKFYNPKLKVEWIALSSNSAKTPQALTYDGRFLASAQTEDHLVIVSVYEAEVKTPVSWGQDSDETRRQLLSQVLPQDYVAMIDDTPSTALADACYTSGDMMDFTLGTAINMTTIDLRTRSIVGNTCLLSDITSLSITDTAIAVQLPNGAVHDFAIDEGEVAYVGVRSLTD